MEKETPKRTKNESEIKDLVQLNYSPVQGADLLDSQTTDAEVEALHKEINLAKAQAKVNAHHRKTQDARDAKHQLVEDQAERMKHLEFDGLIHLKDGTRLFPNGQVVDGVNGVLVQTTDDMEDLDQIVEKSSDNINKNFSELDKSSIDKVRAARKILDQTAQENSAVEARE